LDFLTLEARLGTNAQALDAMRARKGWYDPALLTPFAEVATRAVSHVEFRNVVVRDLRQGMILRENVFTKNGMLLVPKGNEVTPALIERIANFSRKMGVREPIPVTVPAAAAAPPAAAPPAKPG
jgi:hypothetical protein